MKNFGYSLLAAAATAILAAILILNFKHKTTMRNEYIINATYYLSEYAYFEGQKDALEGDIRIEETDSCWVWTKSPWDSDSTGNGRKPIYDPSKPENQWKTSLQSKK